MNVNEARLVLLKESKRIFEKTLHPDGLFVSHMVYDHSLCNSNLPDMDVILYANGTWEYSNVNLRENNDNMD
jgi:hypothetical protein